MPMHSSSPCTQPSSPHTPCSAIQASSTLSCCNAAGRLSPFFQSIPTASHPFDRSPSRTPLPVRKETSRSDEGPPMITPTRLLRCSMVILSHDFDLELQEEPELFAHFGAHHVHQRQHVRGARLAGVDDPVGVRRRHLGAADAPPLQAALLD